MNTLSRKVVAAAALAMLLPMLTLADTTSSPTASPRPQLRTLVGTVSSVNGNSVVFTAGGKTYTADVTNAKIMNKRGQVVTVSIIQKGDMVRVLGSVSDTAVVASTVRDLTQPMNRTQICNSPFASARKDYSQSIRNARKDFLAAMKSARNAFKGSDKSSNARQAFKDASKAAQDAFSAAKSGALATWQAAVKTHNDCLKSSTSPSPTPSQ